jgi:exonuclease III
MKLESYKQYTERKKLPHPTIPNTGDWNLACSTLDTKLWSCYTEFTSEEQESLKKTIQYLKRHMTGETK